MGRVNPIPGRGMAARLALLRVDAEDRAALSADAYDGEIERFGEFATFRRSDDRVFVIQRITAATVSGTRYVLAVIYAPGPARDTPGPVAALVAELGADVVRSWPVSLHADGTLRVAALDADNSPIATAVKAAWPASWRVLLDTDPRGDLTTPPGPPTGPRYLASVLA